MDNTHLQQLGYTLRRSEEAADVSALLKASNLSLSPDDTSGWSPTSYLMACTRAGGTAACVGWTRKEDYAILHSLAVSSTSRGSGVGVGIFAAGMAHILDQAPLEAIYLVTHSESARRLFASAGFTAVDDEDIPKDIANHPIFAQDHPRSTKMARYYNHPRRGLDRCAFQLILNDTKEQTLPQGSVFFFNQVGRVIEGSYRGGTVIRGHLIGAIDGGELKFQWHQYTTDQRLMAGDGLIFVDPKSDGRRELRERFPAVDSTSKNEILLREL